MNQTFIQNNLWILGVLVIWDLFFKGLALWKAAKNDERYWFIALLLINSAGLLPIAYLLLSQRKTRAPKVFLHS